MEFKSQEIVNDMRRTTFANVYMDDMGQPDFWDRLFAFIESNPNRDPLDLIVLYPEANREATGWRASTEEN
jgi:hypothetical protein